MVNLITTMVTMEIQLYGDNVKSDTFYGDFMVKLDQRLGFSWRRQGESNLP